MSGDDLPVLLTDGPDGQVAALVRAAGLVVANAGVPVAVIGGLAVTCRLATAHRVTGDVDLVSDDALDAVTATGAIAGDNLLAAGLATRATGTESVRLLVGGTKIEIIPTYDISVEAAAEVDPERARLFVLAHRWALESATPRRIVVSGTDVEATVPVATPAALLAMKLHSIQDRSEDRKRASDAWDVLRLLSQCNGGGAMGADIRRSPAGLAALVTEALDRVFRAEATRTRRWVRGYGDPAWVRELTDEAMEDAASALIDQVLA